MTTPIRFRIDFDEDGVLEIRAYAGKTARATAVARLFVQSGTPDQRLGEAMAWIRRRRGMSTQTVTPTHPADERDSQKDEIPGNVES